jgi:hypothetical protein
MTLANAPLWLETARVSATDLPDGASGIFFVEGLDGQMTDLPVGQASLNAHDRFARANVFAGQHGPSVADAFSAFDCHQGRGQERDQLFLPAGFGEYLGLGQGQGTARFHNPATGEDAIPDGRRDEIDFEFRRQHAATARHKAQGRVPCRRISDGAQRACVNEAMLL